MFDILMEAWRDIKSLEAMDNQPYKVDEDDFPCDIKVIAPSVVAPVEKKFDLLDSVAKFVDDPARRARALRATADVLHKLARWVEPK